jgi:hypothetical protein
LLLKESARSSISKLKILDYIELKFTFEKKAGYLQIISELANKKRG